MRNYSRKSFLQQTAFSAIALSLPREAGKYANRPADQKLNIALCGLGRYAELLAEGFASSRYCRLAGIVTGTPSKIPIWQKQYGIPDGHVYNYQNFDSISNNKAIDLVYVVLPNSMHKEYVMRTAAAGKHVITEKPMALNAKDCEAMIAACKKAGVQLGMGYRLHYEPYNMEMARLGQQKILGKVNLVQASLGYKVEDNANWRFHKALSGGGALMNLGVYCIQGSRYILGEEPVSVTAQFGPNTQPAIYTEVEASLSWQLIFPSAAVAHCDCFYNANTDRLYASADKGFFELSPAISYGPFKGRSTLGDMHFPDINQQTAQLDGMAKCILDGKPLPAHISGEEGWKDMKVVDAIYESANTGRSVPIR